MKMAVVLPCYNEEKNIKPLIEKIDSNCVGSSYVIVAVNDGSKDKTGEILTILKNRFPLVVVTHKRNMGLNKALDSGFRKAVEITGKSGLVVSMDADLTHDPSYIKKMISVGCDVVVASRYVDCGGQIGVPLLRRVLSLGINLLTRLLFNLQVKDVTSGYRCYKAEVLEKIISRHGENFIEANGFEVSLEILVKAKWQGANMVEVPLILNYLEKRSKSKLKVFKTIVNYLRLVWRLKTEGAHLGREGVLK